MRKYFGIFTDYEELCLQYNISPEDIPASFPRPEEVVAAEYQYQDWNGDAYILFERDGVPYEVYSSHCSCYGLSWEEDDPEETTWGTLVARPGWANSAPEAVTCIAQYLYRKTGKFILFVEQDDPEIDEDW
jgi:hypothetical protein